VEENTPSQSEEGKESGHDFQDNQVKDGDVLDNTETTFTSTKQRLKNLKLSRNKNQKRLTDTPSGADFKGKC